MWDRNWGSWSEVQTEGHRPTGGQGRGVNWGGHLARSSDLGSGSSNQGQLPSTRKWPPPSLHLLPHIHTQPHLPLPLLPPLRLITSSQAWRMPAAPCGESWSQVRAGARGGCGREDQCNHGSQRHLRRPLGCSLEPSTRHHARREEGRATSLPGVMLRPLEAFSSPASLYVRPEVPTTLGTC